MRNWLKQTTLATILLTSAANAQTPQQELQTSTDSLGIFAQHTLDTHAEVTFKDSIIINGISCLGAYNKEKDRIKLLTTYTDKTHRPTLAHELAHAALDTIGMKGLFSHPNYTGPTPKEILAFTKNWYQAPARKDIHQSLEKHLQTIQTITEHRLARQLPLIEVYAKASRHTIPHEKYQQINSLLEEARRNIPRILFINHFPTAYKKTNKLLDQVLTHLKQATQPTQQHPQQINQEQALQTHYFKEHAHQGITNLSEQRKLIRKITAWRKENQKNYFTNPEEIFARVLNSLVEHPHKQSTIYTYKLDQPILNFLKTMHYKNEPLLHNLIERYETTASSSSSEYTTGLELNNEI